VQACQNTNGVNWRRWHIFSSRISQILENPLVDWKKQRNNEYLRSEDTVFLHELQRYTADEIAAYRKQFESAVGGFGNRRVCEGKHMVWCKVNTKTLEMFYNSTL
jgi:hypothetical protein